MKQTMTIQNTQQKIAIISGVGAVWAPALYRQFIKANYLVAGLSQTGYSKDILNKSNSSTIIFR